MGAWGTKVFESDASFEFLEDFIDGKQNIKILKEAFDEVLNETDEIDTVLGENALAAAEIIAIAKGNSYAGFDSPTFEKVDIEKLKHKINDTLIASAIKAIDIVKKAKKSELRELWEDTDDYDEWKADLENLKTRLKI